MRTIAFWFKQTAAFQHQQADGQHKKGETPPIDFFHK
jgi:hypothetical protein